jgi:uncharacterized coiled-coil protein SlyX
MTDHKLESKVNALEAVVANQQIVIEKIVQAISNTPQEIKRHARINGKCIKLVKS